MKTFKQRFQAVLKSLGLVDKAKSEELTQDDWAKIASSYKETHGSTMEEDMEADEEQAKNAENYKKILAVVNKVDESNADEGEQGAQASDDTQAPADVAAKIEAMAKENAENKKLLQEANAKIALLAEKIEPDQPIDKVKETKNVPFQKAHTPEYAFGIEAPMFSMDHRWNKIAANPAFAAANPVTAINDENSVKKSFASELTQFGKMLASRYFELKDQNLLGQIKSADFSVDYSELESQFKNQYVVRRMDALIAQILMSKSISDMFPVRSGVQDMDVITNVLFSEVSSAWQAGKIFKGSADLQPEYGHVDDASIKVLFPPLTEMERQYIGYLNTEGSNPVKMSMIEWYTMNMLTKAIQEKYVRAVRGIYYKPETGVAGSYLNAATGILHTLIRYQHQFKLAAHDDSAFASYTDATMFATVQAFIKQVTEDLTDQEIEDYTICLNGRHRHWFIANLRDSFGQDTDFTGPQSYANVFPDFNIRIYWMPNMLNNDYTMFLTKPGNIQQIENVPGEMMALVYQDDFENITVRSRFKEGVSAAFVGPKFSSKAALIANSFVNQHIYINKAVVAVDPDATTVDAANGYRFLTGINTGATALTDITNAKKGDGYYIEIGDVANATTIAKAGKFSEITEAFTPTAVGDYILVVLNDAGDKFLELERMVGGVRSVNTALQPTLPESRA